MSFCRGNTEALHVVHENGAWTVYDEFGAFDGPYATQGDAVAMIRERRELEDELRGTWSGYLAGV